MAKAIAVKKVKTPGVVSAKHTLNLARALEKKIDWRPLVTFGVILVLVVGVAGKFLIIDRFAKLYAAQREVMALRSEVTADLRTIDDFGELTERYGHYTYSGMTKDELTRADRVEVMEMISRTVMDAAELASWSVKNSVLNMSITADDLHEINEIAAALRNDPLVSRVSVTTAATNSYYWDEDVLVYGDRVTASVTVNLNNSEKEALLK